MREEIENPMLLPEPNYDREPIQYVLLDLTDHYAKMDAINNRIAAESREAAKKDGQAGRKVTA